MHEMPVTHMTREHMDILIEKCSKYTVVEMPEFPEQSQTPRKAADIHDPITVTPSTSERDSSAAGDRESSAADDTSSENDEGLKTAEKSTPSQMKPVLKPNKQMLETHRKWQEAAEAIGGPGSRIIVSKLEAKKAIYDMLYDTFRPMDITQIYHVSCLISHEIKVGSYS
jgi:hypothetical protein